MNPQNAPRGAAGTVAAAVLGIECAIIALAAIAYVPLGLVDDADDAQISFALAAIGALAAAGLGLLTWGLWHARRWAVSPSITWQILQGFVGAYLVSQGEWIYGAAAVALAIVAFVALAVIARGRQSTGEDLHRDGDAVDDGHAAER